MDQDSRHLYWISKYIDTCKYDQKSYRITDQLLISEQVRPQKGQILGTTTSHVWCQLGPDCALDCFFALEDSTEEWRFAGLARLRVQTKRLVVRVLTTLLTGKVAL